MKGNTHFTGTKNKKILLFAPGIFVGGGTERVLVNLANELCKNWQVLIAVNIIGTKKLYHLDESVSIIPFKFGGLRQTRDNLFFKVINKLFKKRIICSFLNQDVFADIQYIISFSPAITGICYHTKYRNVLVSFEHWPFSAYQKHPKVQLEIQATYPNLHSVVVLTEHEKKVYEQMGCNVVRIPNAYSFFPTEAATLKRKIVISVGHFNSQKRRDLLIDAWQIVQTKHPDWKLWIVGEGEQKEMAIAQIERLQLSQSIQIISPTNDIASLYLAASVFVLSSAFEALPLVLLEAKAVGLPCVSFDIVSGPKEIIRDNKDGYLVAFADTAAMAAKIGLLLQDENLRFQFGKAGRADVFERFNPQEIYDKWYRFLEPKNEIQHTPQPLIVS